MKKARTLLAIWLALILTLTLFPTALATGDGSEPTGGATNNSFTVNMHFLEGIANPTQNVENGTWTQGDLVFTFTLTEGYANPSFALTIGDAPITDLTLSGPDSDGKYTLTVPANKITGNVNLSLSAAKEESGEPTTPQGDGNNDANPSGGGTTPPSNSNCKVTFWSGSGTNAEGNYYDLSNVGNMPEDVDNVPAGKYTIPGNIPTIAYNVFLYWTDDSGKKVNPGEEINISSDVNLSAWWQKTADISFNTDGGAGTFNPTKVPLTEGATYTLPKDTPTRAGYVFKGWKDTNGTIYQANAPYTLITSGPGYAVAFTAQWAEAITVTYSRGKAPENASIPAPETIEKGTGGTSYKISDKTPSRNDNSMVFTHYTANFGNKDATYKPGQEVVIPADVTNPTFTAQWTKKYYADDGNDDRPSRPSKPTYDEYRIRATCSDGGWVSPAGSTYVREGRNLTVTFAPYKGYAIDGVYIDGVLDNRYDGSYTFRDVDENHTIYVRYVRDSGSSGGSSGGGSHWDDNTSPKTGDASAPLSMGLGVGSLALIAFLVARKMRRA